MWPSVSLPSSFFYLWSSMTVFWLYATLTCCRQKVMLSMDSRIFRSLGLSIHPTPRIALFVRPWLNFSCSCSWCVRRGLSVRRARRTKSSWPEGPPSRSWGPEGPLTSSCFILEVIGNSNNTNYKMPVCTSSINLQIENHNCHNSPFTARRGEAIILWS